MFVYEYGSAVGVLVDESFLRTHLVLARMSFFFIPRADLRMVSEVRIYGEIGG